MAGILYTAIDPISHEVMAGVSHNAVTCFHLLSEAAALRRSERLVAVSADFRGDFGRGDCVSAATDRFRGDRLSG